MKITLKTEKLKDMISRSVKGAGNNKLIPLTSLMAIEVKDSILTIITTDATNYLYVTDKVLADDFYVVVDVNMFSKLVAKMTCENITLEIKSGIQMLEVKGNGSYKIELPLDENGEPIRYPDPYDKLKLVSTDYGSLNKSTIQVILESVKPALALNPDVPCYASYYVGDQVIATDSNRIASMNIKLFENPSLISSDLMDLLAVINTEKIQVEVSENNIIFITPDCIIVSKFMEGIEDFAIDQITELVNVKFNSMCSVPKTVLLQLLDRLSLFVGPYDNNAISLTFTNAGLQVSSKAANSVEIIDYIASNDFIDFTCFIDIQMFIQEIKAIKSDVISIYYGEDNAIKLVDGNITIIIALLEDDESMDE